MNRLNIQDENITFGYYEDDLHEVFNGDEMGYYPLSMVWAEVHGKRYIYPSHFLAKFIFVDEIGESVFVNSRQLCEDFIARIKQHGSINLNKWEEQPELEPRNLEQEWRNDYEEEQFLRGHGLS